MIEKYERHIIEPIDRRQKRKYSSISMFYLDIFIPFTCMKNQTPKNKHKRQKKKRKKILGTINVTLNPKNGLHTNRDNTIKSSYCTPKNKNKKSFGPFSLLVAVSFYLFPACIGS